MSCNVWCARLCAMKSYGPAFLLAVLFLGAPTMPGAQEPKPTLKDVLGAPTQEPDKAVAVPVEAPSKTAEKSAPAPKEAPAVPVAKDAIPQDEYNRGTPRRSVQGFLDATAARDYIRAAKYLDLHFLPPWYTENDGAKLARKLKVVLDRSPLWVDPNRLSDVPVGNARSTDGLAENSDRLGRIKTDKRAVDVTLDRVSRPDGVEIWLFSSETVGEVPYLYDQFGFGVLAEILPEWIFDYDLFGLGAWLWAGILIVGVIGYLAAFILTRLALLCLRLTRMKLGDRVERVVTGPVRLMLFIVVVRTGIEMLGPSVGLRALMNAKTLPIIAVVWLVMRVLDLFMDRVAQHLNRAGQSGAIVLLPPIRNGLKLVVVAMAFVVWLDNIGFQVSTLLAGLGIGGLAIALGLQKTIENMVGALTLYMSQPVRVGDFCRFGSVLGNVEEIGLRATTIRTLDRTLVHVPNAEFVNLHLDNFQERDMIWFHPKIKLRYDTTPEQVRYIVVEVRRMLYSHPKVLSEPQHVRFIGFTEHSLDLDIFAYVRETDYGVYLGVAEDLNLRIMDIVAAAGAQLAIPAQATFVERSHGPDDGRVAETAEQVQVWREEKSLYMPEFPKEKIAELHDAIDFPNQGSPGARGA